MKNVLSFLIVIALCASCSLTNNWQGTSLPRKNNASFEHFTGQQKFDFKLDLTTGYTRLDYKISLDYGEIQMIVMHEKKEIMNVSTSTSIQDSIHITNSNDLNVEIFLVGKDARGSYQMELKNP